MIVCSLSRCAPVLAIILRVLAAYTQACRVYMDNHIQSNPVLDGNNQIEQDRLELKNALLAAQESAIIQILLEYCQPKPEEKQVGNFERRWSVKWSSGYLRIYYMYKVIGFVKQKTETKPYEGS